MTKQQQHQNESGVLMLPFSYVYQTVSLFPDESTSRKNRRIRLKTEDKQSERYECFCNRQYLSYCALYNHLRKKHFQFFSQNNPYSVASNIVATVDPQHGYKIRKLLQQNVQLSKTSRKTTPCPTYKRNRTERIKGLEELKKTQKMVDEAKDLKILLAKKLQITERKLQKQCQLVQLNELIIQSYENIMSLLNIQSIEQQLHHKKPLIFAPEI